MFWICLIAFFLGFVDASTNASAEGCKSEPSCLKCSPKGCIKCPDLIVYPSRQCVTTCPTGYDTRWSTRIDYLGHICVRTGNFLGLSSETTTVLVGVLAGTILSVILIGAAVVFFKIKRKSLHQNTETSSDADEPPERRDFIKQLDSLRPHAQTFLDMLNDTRQQMRELHKSGDTGDVAAYKPLVRDLARILLLLNRRADVIAVPEDWEQLFAWAERTLRRHKRMSGISQPQVTQLITFLQGPLQAPQEELRNSTSMSTFKPDQIFGSSLSLQSAVLKNFGCGQEGPLHHTLNPQWKFEYSPVNTVPTSEFDPVAWKNSREHLNSSSFADDDLCQLGFRPQDEITTEL